MRRVVDSSETGTPFFFNAGRIGCLLLHGFTGTPYALRKLGEALHARGLTVHAPLLPGHGTKPADLLKVHYHDWIRTGQNQVMILKEQCDVVFIIGLSMGGTLGLYLASENNVDGLIALSAPIERSRFQSKKYQVMRHIIRYWPKWSSLIKSCRPELGYRLYPLPAVEMFLSLLSVTRERLQTMTCPVLLMHSRYDRTVSSDQMDFLYEKIGSFSKEQILLDTKQHAVTLSSAYPVILEKVLDFIDRWSREKGGSAEHRFQAAPGSFNP